MSVVTLEAAEEREKERRNINMRKRDVCVNRGGEERSVEESRGQKRGKKRREERSEVEGWVNGERRGKWSLGSGSSLSTLSEH